MKKIVLLVLVASITFGCASIMSSKKTTYKQVNERDVPERYVKDLKRQRPTVVQPKWEQVDSVTYNANFVEKGNDVRIQFSNKGTSTYWLVPTEYVPTNITDYVAETYKDFKIEEVTIADINNRKVYRAFIRSKKEVKTLEFDLTGKFTSEAIVR